MKVEDLTLKQFIEIMKSDLRMTVEGPYESIYVAELGGNKVAIDGILKLDIELDEQVLEVLNI